MTTTISGCFKTAAIGLGTAHWFGPPLPPNRTGGFPASGSPVDGFTSVTVLRKIALENRLDHVHHRRLNHPVPHRGDAQRPGLRRSRFGDVRASYGLGLVRSAAELVRQFPEALRQPSLKLRDRHVVHSRGTPISRHLLERGPQIPLREHFVKQPKPFPSFHSLFQSRQHADGPGTRLDPSPAREDLSGLLSQRHCRRCCFHGLGHPTSIFLEPFAPPALPGFVATMAPLTPGRWALWVLMRGHELPPVTTQVSFFKAFDLPSIPSSTTVLPFPQHGFRTLPQSDGLPRLSPGKTSSVEGLPSRGQGFTVVTPAPRQAWPNQVRYPTDWTFTSSCSPPLLTETRLLSVTSFVTQTRWGLAPHRSNTFRRARDGQECPSYGHCRLGTAAVGWAFLPDSGSQRFLIDLRRLDL